MRIAFPFRISTPSTRPGTLLAALFALSLTGCGSTGESGPAAIPVEASALELELGVERARLVAERLVAGAQAELGEAERRRAETDGQLDAFRNTDQPLREDEQFLAHDRAVARLALAARELGAAQATGDRVRLEAAIAELDHAERALAIEERKLERLLREELPRMERALQAAVVASERALGRAATSLEIAEVEGRLLVERARTALRTRERVAEGPR